MRTFEGSYQIRIQNLNLSWNCLFNNKYDIVENENYEDEYYESVKLMAGYIKRDKYL